MTAFRAECFVDSKVEDFESLRKGSKLDGSAVRRLPASHANLYKLVYVPY